MKNILMLIVSIFFLLTIIPLCSSEEYLFNRVILNNDTSIVRYHAFYTFDDTSMKGIGKNKDVPIIISYYTENLPYNLTGYSGQVDWCNLSTIHYHNIYGTTFIAFQGFIGGELLNTTIETQNLYFNSGINTGEIIINMRDKDSLTINMDCHYTNNNSLYVENILIGRFNTITPSYECDGCEEYTLEELSNEADRNEQITEEQLQIYNNIQKIITLNFQIWLYGSWVLKILFILVAVGLVFASGYFIYLLLMNLTRRLR